MRNLRIRALHFNAHNTVLALVYRDYTYLWHRRMQRCEKIEGKLYYTAARSCAIQGNLVRYLFKFREAHLPLYSPFTRNGSFLATLTEDNRVIIWSISNNGTPENVDEFDLFEKFGKTASDVSAWYFVDDDRTLHIEYVDKIYSQRPLIIDSLPKP